MDAGEAREVVTAWKVFRTVHEMLEDRVSPTIPPQLATLETSRLQSARFHIPGLQRGRREQDDQFPRLSVAVRC